MHHRYTHIIWDFNGTVYDDVAAGVSSANKLLRAHGMREFSSIEEYRELFGFPIIEYYRRMGFDFEKTPYDALANEWIPYYMEASREARAFPAAVSALSLLQKKGVSQILLSATEREMLCGQLQELGLTAYFDEVLGQDTIHAYGKERIGEMWRAQNPDARAILIGDTEHDAEVASLMGADCVLLACGHQSRKKLEKCRNAAIYDSHEEFLTVFLKSQCI